MFSPIFKKKCSDVSKAKSTTVQIRFFVFIQYVEFYAIGPASDKENIASIALYLTLKR